MASTHRDDDNPRDRNAGADESPDQQLTRQEWNTHPKSRQTR